MTGVARIEARQDREAAGVIDNRRGRNNSSLPELYISPWVYRKIMADAGQLNFPVDARRNCRRTPNGFAAVDRKGQRFHWDGRVYGRFGDGGAAAAAAAAG